VKHSGTLVGGTLALLMLVVHGSLAAAGTETIVVELQSQLHRRIGAAKNRLF